MELTSDRQTVSSLNPLPGIAKAFRGTPILHRTAITAPDKCAASTITAVAQDAIVGVMANTVHRVAVAPRNVYGSAGASAIVTVTPTLNKTVDITIPQSVGATHYEIFFSTATAPLWVGYVTEAQRATGAAIDAVGHTIAGGSPGVVNVRLVGTGLASNNDIHAQNTAYIPDAIAAAVGTTVVDCSGYPTAYIDIDLSMSHLGTVPPAISILCFTLTGTIWSACDPKSLTLLSSPGYPLRQAFSLAVGGAPGVLVLVDAIAGAGASAAITVTPGV